MGSHRRVHAKRWLTPATLLLSIAAGALLVGGASMRASPHGAAWSPPFVAHLTGLLAGYGVTVMLGMVSRVPMLERDVGADRLARWHAVGGRFIFLLVAAHAVAATMTWIRGRHTSLWRGTGEVLRMPGVLAATAGTVLLLAVGYLSARRARRKVSYERWHAAHLLMYVAVGLSFSHQLAGPDLAGTPALQVAWSLLYCYVFALVLRYRLIAPLHQAWRHSLVVQRIVPEADGVASIVMKGRHLDELAAEPGQFFRWRFLNRHSWKSAYPFSLSAPPTDELLRVTVKALGPGSTALHALRPGTRVLAEGPYGAMTERRRRKDHVLLIAGGVGVTPMRALFEKLSVPGRNLTLLYRASRASDVVFRDELDAIAEARGARVIYLVGPSSDAANALTPETLHTLVPNLHLHDVYLCASPAMSAAVRSALRGAGVARSRLHEERFSF
ncbi:MAG: hypothetical protein QOF57_2679 [Frankiaceae bacterium]|nr:hypothetical protein [Frankiaceae bacterium]MDQ1727286.1 hypothetical protein [Frankiaceae bacterium]